MKDLPYHQWRVSLLNSSHSSCLENRYVYFSSTNDLKNYVWEMTTTIGISKEYKLNLDINATELSVHTIITKPDIWITENICKN